MLPGGIRVISETVPTALTTSLGLWFEVGSRDEDASQSGASHFLEHLLFKGTKTRNAMEIAESFDRVGADNNAATSKEFTYYWARFVDSELPAMLDVLVDMVSASVLEAKDVEVERGVILDELAMSDDTPTDVVQEAFARTIYGNSPLGRPVGGSPETVRQMGPDTIRDLYKRTYSPSTMVVAAAGKVDHEQLCDLVLRAVQKASWGWQEETKPAPRRYRNAEDPPAWFREEAPGFLADDVEWDRETVINRDVEQGHIIVGGPWLPAEHRLLPVSALTLNLLGGGMASRFFQEIREKRGLAYSTYAFASSYADAGNFALYAGTAPTNLAEAEKLLWAEVENLAEEGPTEGELERVKGQLRGLATLELESMNARMVRLARSELSGKFYTVEDVLERFSKVSAQDVALLSKLLLHSPRSSAVVTARG